MLVFSWGKRQTVKNAYKARNTISIKTGLKFNVTSALLRATSSTHEFSSECFFALALQNICSCFILAKELLPINLVEDAQTEVNIDCTSGEFNWKIPSNQKCWRPLTLMLKMAATLLFSFLSIFLFSIKSVLIETFSIS